MSSTTPRASARLQQQKDSAAANVVMADSSAPDSDGSGATTDNKAKPKVGSRDIHMVQTMIERCLKLYMTQKDVIQTLQTQAKVDASFTTLVWQKLEEQNKEFFQAYYLRLQVKEHTVMFNHLLEQQEAMMTQLHNSWMQAMPSLMAQAASGQLPGMPSGGPVPPGMPGGPVPPFPGMFPGMAPPPFPGLDLSDAPPPPIGLDLSTAQPKSTIKTEPAATATTGPAVKIETGTGHKEETGFGLVLPAGQHLPLSPIDPATLLPGLDDLGLFMGSGGGGGLGTGSEPGRQEQTGNSGDLLNLADALGSAGGKDHTDHVMDLMIDERMTDDAVLMMDTGPLLLDHDHGGSDLPHNFSMSDLKGWGDMSGADPHDAVIHLDDNATMSVGVANNNTNLSSSGLQQSHHADANQISLHAQIDHSMGLGLSALPMQPCDDVSLQDLHVGSGVDLDADVLMDGGLTALGMRDSDDDVSAVLAEGGVHLDALMT